ncbi:hypothetical protein JYT72_02720 [Crocinitomix catalasitica]|nr:hypothetical protein [Crocinitomix catalasitica]
MICSLDSCVYFSESPSESCLILSEHGFDSTKYVKDLFFAHNADTIVLELEKYQMERFGDDKEYDSFNDKVCHERFWAAYQLNPNSDESRPRGECPSRELRVTIRKSYSNEGVGSGKRKHLYFNINGFRTNVDSMEELDTTVTVIRHERDLDCFIKKLVIEDGFVIGIVDGRNRIWKLLPTTLG